jgi:hypothetical protein
MRVLQYPKEGILRLKIGKHFGWHAMHSFESTPTITSTLLLTVSSLLTVKTSTLPHTQNLRGDELEKARRRQEKTDLFLSSTGSMQVCFGALGVFFAIDEKSALVNEFDEIHESTTKRFGCCRLVDAQ